ncbi:MAG TPA: hypothetical protein VLC91_11360 [Spongiibacteraceae bacterium]|nr:hypothetical protein [Spongiibacteraceae bacterium]
MSARANHFARRRGADAQLPAVIKIVLTLFFSTLFLGLVLLGDHRAGASSHVDLQKENHR